MNKFTSAQEFIAWVESQKRFSPKVSLSKMFYLMSLFDNPHEKFSSIHVTGTNGKGSVVSFLKNILIASGFNVATYTSPYITCFNERICYNNEMIGDDDLVKIANEIIEKYPVIENSEYEYPTFFEFITLLAFIYYSRIKNLDLVIVEVGMGGLLDSTNVITPLISVITNVTLEHTKILGRTKREIALQKLGIVKSNVPLVSSEQDQELQKLFEEYTKSHGSKYISTLPGEVEIIKQDIYSSEIILKGLNFKIGLSGNHQIENALCAYETIQVLKELNKKWKNQITYETCYRGFLEATWQGRMEVVSKDPLIIIDGCHNIDGVTKVTSFVKTLNYPKKRAIISISNDKDKKEMLEEICNTFDEIICTKYTYSRSADVKELYDLLQDFPNKMIIEKVQDAVEYSLKHPVDFTMFMGSLYLVSEVRNIIKPLK